MGNLLLVAADGQEQKDQAWLPAAGESVIIAIDLSRTKWVWCVRWKGREQRMTTPGGLEHLAAIERRYADCDLHFVYEACGFGYEIAWYLQTRGHDVMVIAPCTVEQAPGRRVKTDRLDASTIARKREQGQLKGIYIPVREIHEQRQLVRSYLQMRKDRRRQQARTRALLQEMGRIGPSPARGWKAYVDWLQQETLPTPVAINVQSLLELRQHADERAKRIHTALLACAKDPSNKPIVEGIARQPGIGILSAIWLRLELAELRRFASGKALVRYLGLAPSEHSSGDMVRRGHILKCGPGTLRALLIECAWRSVRADHGDPQLRAFYQRLCRSGHQPKQAIVAVARKLAMSVFAHWSHALAQRADAA